MHVRQLACQLADFLAFRSKEVIIPEVVGMKPNEQLARSSQSISRNQAGQGFNFLLVG